MDSGSYCLIIKLQKNIKLRIRENKTTYPKGFYCYVGSALNGLEKEFKGIKGEKRRFSGTLSICWSMQV
ncbi:MAG: hypothetical protein QXK37_05505 [Candidatus Woesearchaeota archaeon]